jgi:hypothetical protein
MKNIGAVMAVFMAAVMPAGDGRWYVGDERCPPPRDDGSYSAPYNAIDHRNDYPVFAGADKPGWSCSYRREDGVIVQYGDSRTPQEQWMAVWGDKKSE